MYFLYHSWLEARRLRRYACGFDGPGSQRFRGLSWSDVIGGFTRYESAGLDVLSDSDIPAIS